MISVDSNLAGVRQRMQRLQTAVPPALERTLADPGWRAEARKIALAAIRSCPRPAGVPLARLAEYAHKFVETIVQEVWEGGFVLILRNPFPALAEARTLADFIAAEALRPDAGTLDVNLDLFFRQVQELDEWLVEWVATEKHKSRVDQRKSDEEIAAFIRTSLLTPAGQQRRVQKGRNVGKLVKDVFEPHIVNWIRWKEYQKGTSGRLSAETISAWLRVVLAAWRELVRVRAPQKFFAELRTHRERLI